jgi:imidazolonepropionase-like amidohydrolase
MKLSRKAILIFAIAIMAAGFAGAPAAHAQAQQSYAITGAKVFPISGPPMEGATIIIRDGKISAVGKGVAIPSGAKVIDARGLEVYPGMFNAITEMGINEVGEGAPGSVDTTELGEYNPQLVTASAVNPASAHIPVTRAEGITHVISAMGAGGGRGGGGSVIPGQASLFNLAGWTMDEMQIRRSAAMTVNWPVLPGGAGGGGRGGAAAAGAGNTRGEYDRRIAELTEWLDRARHYSQATQNKANFERDLKLEALVPVVKGEMPLFVMANQANQIREAVAFCDKQKLKLIIATGTAAGEVKDLLKEKNVPVVLRPTLTLVRSEDDPYDLSLSLASELSKAGVKFAYGSFGNEFARRLSQQVGNSVAYGLSHDEALKALTIYPAEMFGVEKELGTIEVGKMANLIITNGDPLELTTDVRYLFIRGQLTSTDNRHRQLYEEYRKRP